MHLLLLRHGQTASNLTGALDTAVPGASLNDVGARQAGAAALALADRGIAGIYTSNLARTAETAGPLADALSLDVVVLDGLQEVLAGDYEMETDEESVLGYISTLADWIGGNLDKQVSGGESGHQFLARFDDAVAHIHADGHPTALLVSHGAAIRVWIANRVVDSLAHPRATEGFANTACIELEGDPSSGWQILAWTSVPVGDALLDDPIH